MNDIKVIEPISKHTKEFDTVDEFNLYYNKHKNDMDSLTTHKLNKMYYIKGYHITKIKNVLMLKKIKEENINGECKALRDKVLEQKNIDSQSEALRSSEISELKQEIKQIKETINNIIHFINPQSDHCDNIVLPPSDT